MATGAGYDVITTCSLSNFDYIESLGAVKAFDYKNPTVIKDVVDELDKGECVGIYMAAGSNATACEGSFLAVRLRQKRSELWTVGYVLLLETSFRQHIGY